MAGPVIKKQVAREYYNVLYSAKLHFASFDLCEKIPTLISVISLSIGVLGLAFANMNSNELASALLILGIIGITLKPRELHKEEYKVTGVALIELSKKLENIYCYIDDKDPVTVQKARNELVDMQREHSSIITVPPVMLASWYAHYKVFSEHNSEWMCEELGLDWKDKFPLNLRATILVVLIGVILWVNPYCLTSKGWAWISEPCKECSPLESEIKNSDN